MVAFDEALLAIKSRDLTKLKEIFLQSPELRKRDGNKKYPADLDGRTLLYLAVGDKFEGMEGEEKKEAEKANFEIIKYLITTTPSAVNQTKSGNNASPLFLATQNNRANVAEELVVKGGANVDIKTQVKYSNQQTQELTALQIAEQKGFKLIQEIIKRKLPIQIKRLDIEEGRLDILANSVKEIISGNCSNLSMRDLEKTPLLHIATVAGNFPIVQFLVDNGFDHNLQISEPEYGGLSPAMIAAQKGRLNILEFFIEQGIRPELKSRDNSILLLALVTNQMQALEMLLSGNRKNPRSFKDVAVEMLRQIAIRNDKKANEAASVLLSYFEKHNMFLGILLQFAINLREEEVKFLLNTAKIEDETMLINFLVSFAPAIKENKAEAYSILKLVLENAKQNQLYLDINKPFAKGHRKITLLGCAVSFDKDCKKQWVDYLLNIGADPRVAFRLFCKPIDFVKQDEEPEVFNLLKHYEKFLNIKDRLPEQLKDKITIKNADQDVFLIELKLGDGVKTIECDSKKSESKIIVEVKNQEQLLKDEKLAKSLDTGQQKAPKKPKSTLAKPETKKEQQARLKKELEDEEKAEKSRLIKEVKDSVIRVNDALSTQESTPIGIDDLKSAITESFKTPVSRNLTTQKNKLFKMWIALAENIDDPKQWTEFNRQLFIFISNIEMSGLNDDQSDRVGDLKLVNDLKKVFANLHINLFHQIKDRDFSQISLPELRNQKLLFEQISNLQQSSKPNKELAKLKSKQQLSALFLKEELAGNLDEALGEAINKYKPEEWARIFEPKSLKGYSQEDLEKIAPYFAQKLAELEENGANKLIENIARNLVANNDIAGAAFKFGVFLDLLSDDQKFQLQDQLYQQFNQLGNTDLYKAASFLVAVENLIFKTEDSLKTVEAIDAFVDKELEGLRPKIDQGSNQNWQQKTRQDKGVILALNKLEIDEKFTVILLCSPHGKQAQNPHIQKTAQQLIVENLATSKQELEEKLGKGALGNIEEEDLQKVTQILADNFCHIQARGSGSHNSCIVLPKVFPNKKSPITDDAERQSYIANINELCQAVASQKMPTSKTRQ